MHCCACGIPSKYSLHFSVYIFTLSYYVETSESLGADLISVLLTPEITQRFVASEMNFLTRVEDCSLRDRITSKI